MQGRISITRGGVTSKKKHKKHPENLSEKNLQLTIDAYWLYNPGHNVLALFNNLAQVGIATSKTILDI